MPKLPTRWAFCGTDCDNSFRHRTRIATEMEWTSAMIAVIGEIDRAPSTAERERLSRKYLWMQRNNPHLRHDKSRADKVAATRLANLRGQDSP